MKRVLILLGFAFAAPTAFAVEEPVAAAESSTSALIRGFAQYQAGRVESLILDNFVDELATGAYFKQFFPQTSLAVRDYDGLSGKRLIPLMQHYFKADVKTLEDIAACFKNFDSRLADPAQSATALKQLAGLFQLLDDRTLTTTTYLQNKCAAASAATLTELKTGIGNAIKAQNVEPKPSLQALANEKNVLVQLAAVKENAGWLGDDNLKAVYAQLPESSQKLLKARDWTSIRNAMKALEAAFGDSEEMSPSLYVHHLLVLLEALGFSEDDYTAFRHFKSSALFLASLKTAADERSAAAVRGAIDEFVDEESASNDKRAETGFWVARRGKPDLWCLPWVVCRETVFVGSFFGVSTASLDDDNDGNDSIQLRAFGPVGIEIKLATLAGRPVSVTAAPFDLGTYITNELAGSDYEAKLEDIKAPAYFLSYSFISKPVSLNAGYQRNVVTTAGGNDRDSFYFIALTFDLPVLTLY